MAQITFKLFQFALETSGLNHSTLNTPTQAENLFGKDRFDRINNLYEKYDKKLYDDNTTLIDITDEELSDIMFLYYDNNHENKTIDDIKNDLAIKLLLE